MMRFTPLTCMLVLLTTLCGGGVQAQIVYGAHYDVGYNNISWVRAVADGNGGLFISARPIGDSVNLFASSILNTDNSGEVASLICYNDGGSDLITCMERTNNGDVVTGSLTSGHFDQPDATDIMLRRIMPDGTLDWAKAYAVDGQYHADLYDIVQTPSGSFIGLGSFSQDGGDAKPLLFGFTGAGEVLWSNGLHTANGSLQCLSLTLDPAGGVIATGRFADTPNSTKMLVIHADTTGVINWSHWYGSTGFNEASTALIRPGGGLAILGSLQGANGAEGAVVRTEADGTPISMSGWGLHIQNGHVFNDGSVMVLCGGYDARTAIARIDTNNAIQWSTLLSATPWGDLVPLGGGTRFAYVSSEMFSDVTVNTLTDQCETCNADSVPFTVVTTTWADDGSPDVYVLPVNMESTDLFMVPTPVNAIMSPECMLVVGMEEHIRPDVVALECAFDPSNKVLSLDGDPLNGRSVMISDMLGRLLFPNGAVVIEPNARSIRTELPVDLVPGYYLAKVLPGGAACVFAVPPR